jgi:hypothetical protein
MLQSETGSHPGYKWPNRLASTGKLAQNLYPNPTETMGKNLSGESE